MEIMQGDIMSIINSFCMLFLSFCPLWISVLIIDAKSIYEGKSNLLTEKISITLIILFLIITYLTLCNKLKSKATSNELYYNLKSAKEEKTITPEYMVSYILPLFVFDFKMWDGVILFLVFFFMLAFLVIRHNYFSINIVLELKGYKFYNCVLKNADNITIQKIVISKAVLPVKNGELIKIRPINNEYCIDVSTKEKNVY